MKVCKWIGGTALTRTRLTAWLLLWITVWCMVTPFSALAEEPTTEDVKYIEPKLGSDVDPYDPEHPEDLQEEQLLAKSAILIEATTGEVIFEKDADAVMYPASTTKIMTVLLGIMMGDMNATVTMDSVAADVPADSSTTKLEVGENINFKDLLYATMLRSGNDGANLIAESISGNINDFVVLMNQAAAMYGCTNTNFMNPTGLHDDNHYTTVRDMAKIAQAAMQNDTFREIVKTYAYSLPRSNLQKSRVIISGSDSLLNPSEDNEFYYSYANGIKTGYHSRAGNCFVGSAEKDGVQLISVVFYTSANGRWTDTKKLMEYGFSQFVSVTPMELYQINPTIIETTGYSMEDEDIGRLQLDIEPMESTRTVNIVATKSEVETMASNMRSTVLIEYTRDFATPVTKGEVFGTLTYYPTDGGSSVVYQLVASRSIARRENAPKSLEEIEAETYADPNPFPPFSLELALLIASPFVALFILIRILMRVFHKTGRRKHSRVPKPGNRYFR